MLLYELLNGRAFFGPSPTELLREAWAAWGKWITAQWIETFPGTRPFAWWLCDAPGERRTTDYFDREHASGRDSMLIHGILYTCSLPPKQESEVDYLRREGLLSAEEEAALSAGDYKSPCSLDGSGAEFRRRILVESAG